MPYAPSIKLGNGEECIPQHYLLYNHSIESVQRLILDIEFDDQYPIFVCQDLGGIYLQVAIIGFDNYQRLSKQRQQKIVYGRKWRVEAQLPTSEIIQTVFLAIKTAREHEVRELFRVRGDHKISTPFNNHHDLPLMAQHSEHLALCGPAQVQAAEQAISPLAQINALLGQIRYDSAKLKAIKLVQHNSNCYLLDLQITPDSATKLPELRQETQTLLLNSLSENALYFQLMEFFLSMSARQIEENFSYQGFKRFSRNNNVAAIAELSLHLRDQQHLKSSGQFSEKFAQANYDTDKTRVPKIPQGKNGSKLRKQLTAFGDLLGQLPG